MISYKDDSNNYTEKRFEHYYEDRVFNIPVTAKNRWARGNDSEDGWKKQSEAVFPTT